MSRTAGTSSAGERPLNRRQQQAAETRQAIIRAAWSLFAQVGYTRTTIAAIAQAANVSVPSVYLIFGTKQQLLAEVRHTWFTDADMGALIKQALAESDPRQRLRIAAAWMRLTMETGAELAVAIDEATRTEPTVAELWSGHRAGAEKTLREVLSGIENAFAPGIDLDSAVAIVWALSRASVYLEFVHWGWPPARYERWLAETLFQQLLGDRTVLPGASAR
jgi:AcrR family transcriptional regulator